MEAIKTVIATNRKVLSSSWEEFDFLLLAMMDWKYSRPKWGISKTNECLLLVAFLVLKFKAIGELFYRTLFLRGICVQISHPIV